MLNKKVAVWIVIFLWSCMILPQLCHANPDVSLGQVIYIKTGFRHLRGRGTFSIVIRDLDHNQNIPYLFEINGPYNNWLIYLRSRNYVILSSRLQIDRYNPCCNEFKNYRLYNFCQLESCGRIMRNKSTSIIITGDLTPHPYTFSCQVNAYPAPFFTIVTLPDCPCNVAAPAVATGVVPPAPLVASAPPIAAAAPVAGSAETIAAIPQPVIATPQTVGIAAAPAAPLVAATTPVVAAAPSLVAGAPSLVTPATPVIAGPPIVAAPPTAVVQPTPIVSPTPATPLVVTPPQPTIPVPAVARTVATYPRF